MTGMVDDDNRELGKDELRDIERKMLSDKGAKKILSGLKDECQEANDSEPEVSARSELRSGPNVANRQRESHAREVSPLQGWETSVQVSQMQRI